MLLGLIGGYTFPLKGNAKNILDDVQLMGCQVIEITAATDGRINPPVFFALGNY